MSKIEVNFGGRIEPGRQYVYTLTNIVASPGVVQLPEEFKGKMMFAPGGAGNKYHEMLTQEQTEIVKNFVVPKKTSKAGKEYEPSKTVDEILFILTNDETGSETGKYDFAFGMYPGFRPDNNFKAFLLTTKGIDAGTLGGKKDLGEIFNVGTDKFVITTKAELRDGKWAQIERTSITPYTPGMKLESTGGPTVDVSEKLLEMIKSKAMNPIELMNSAVDKIGTREEVTKGYNTLKTAGKIRVEGNVVVVA
jgi:hypothetical protein